ncbi:hypothetical protein ACFWAY_30235 [Rhodococcus sp. NPDC059968]|uniref:hypothetical protein n=1 Tax=Rhodococcus sp. NPDC059968 TaxID=3347017 RepID=UPI0036705EE4
MISLSAQSMPVGKIAEVTFTRADRVRDVIHNFSTDGFASLYPPQGGVISPLLLDVALHGMESAAGVRYHVTGTHAGKTMSGCPVVIRYADDLLALPLTCTGRAGQGAAGGVVGSQGFGLQ